MNGSGHARCLGTIDRCRPLVRRSSVLPGERAGSPPRQHNCERHRDDRSGPDPMVGEIAFEECPSRVENVRQRVGL